MEDGGWRMKNGGWRIANGELRSGYSSGGRAWLVLRGDPEAKEKIAKTLTLLSRRYDACRSLQGGLKLVHALRACGDH
ncbi:MAG: hypothetical protein E3J21_19170 [Anaerolineales bacterium]|nr:MAG: hypothetical protein E3J21_19170 [Anaerolineales bacterium]